MHHHMIEVAVAIIVVIGIVSIVVFAIYNSIISDKEEKLALIEARSKERLALIDKGMDPSLADVNVKRISRIPYNALLWGLLLGGFSLGLFIGYITVVMFGGHMGFIAHAMGMLFGGIGLIVYYLIRKKNDGK